MLACAHPAVDAAARTPLMLQAVLGLSAERMASAFLTSPAAMTKRLVRAKAKLAAAGVRFTLPGPEALVERMEPVLDAVYAAFTLSRDGGGDRALQDEALWLARLLAELAVGEPEAAGLLALTLFVSSRETAVDELRPSANSNPPIGIAAGCSKRRRCCARRAGLGDPGRFQLEAAIQAVHADRRRTMRTDWTAILTLYDGLILIAPTIGAQVARAAALAQSGDPAAALSALDMLDPARVAAHQPYWAARAYALAADGQKAAAADAYLRAAGLTEHHAIRAWLLEQRVKLEN
jgi:RNA polymerase sigma-70 factor (ECF subfamily)